jgi:hypothetical protein
MNEDPQILHVFEIFALYVLVWNIEEDTMEHEGLERRST